MIFENILRKSKDAALSAVVKIYANNRLSAVGKITGLSLNSMEKRVSASLLLKGEKEAVRLDVNTFEILRESGKCFFVVKEIACSREWIEAAAKKFLVEKKVEIPAGVGMLAGG